MSPVQIPSERDVRVVFQPNGRQGNVAPGLTVLEAAQRLGVELESICGGRQTCGKCRVVIEVGQFDKFGIRSSLEHVSPPGAAERSCLSRWNAQPDERLGCACVLFDNVVVRVPDASQSRKQVVRKEATLTRTIVVDPCVRLYYVELPPAELSDHRGDWERLASVLTEVHGLRDVVADIKILQILQSELAKDSRRVTLAIKGRQRVLQIRAGFHDDVFGVAMDVGTTTIAAHLCHLRTGDILASASCMNPQVAYGEDLMSRISYVTSNTDGLSKLHESVVAGINDLVFSLTDSASLHSSDIVEMVMVGNTTMQHLVMGIDPRELGGAPFSLATQAPIDVKARDLEIGIAQAGEIHFPASEAGHVGSDNVGVLVAEEPYLADELALIIDVGTNGEIVLGNRQGLTSASSPTGPAFEGAQIRHGMRAADGAIERVRVDPKTLDVRYRLIGSEEWFDSETTSDAPNAISGINRSAQKQPLGICGSGIIEAIAELLMAGVITANGRFAPIQHPRLCTGLGEGGAKAAFVLVWAHESATGDEIVVHTDDIRAVQLAKAALYAGAKLLMLRMNISAPQSVRLAGGFGSYLSPLHVMTLGMVPSVELSRIKAVGNAAGDGARMILLDVQKRVEAGWVARTVDYVDTAVEPGFQDEFVAALAFPHARDRFAEVETIMAKKRLYWDSERLAAEIDAKLPAGTRSSATSRAERRSRHRMRGNIGG